MANEIGRLQMTFYSSFYDAIDSMPKKDQLPVFRAVVSYGLYGQHTENLTAAQNAFFILMKPSLDSSRRKAASGKNGGAKTEANRKQTESKTEANRKQTEREKEKEIEIEKEIEYKCKKADFFERFWQAYPRKVGKVKAEAAFKKVDVEEDVLMAALEYHKRSDQWKRDNGQFIPHAATWLNGKRWEDQLEQKAQGQVRQLDADEQEAIRRMMEGSL